MTLISKEYHNSIFLKLILGHSRKEEYFTNQVDIKNKMDNTIYLGKTILIILYKSTECESQLNTFSK